MDISAYDNKLASLNHQVDVKQKEMAGIYNEFVDATVKDSIMWSKNKIEKNVEINHKLTLSHQEARLQTLKKECKDLIKRMPGIVEETLNNDKYWIHTQSLPFLKEFYSKNNNYEERLEKNILKVPLSMIRGHAGLILSKAGYVDLHDPNSEWGSYNDRSIRYDPQFDLNGDMKKLVEDYSEKSKELKQFINKIESVENDKARYMAIKRWKQIKID